VTDLGIAQLYIPGLQNFLRVLLPTKIFIHLYSQTNPSPWHETHPFRKITKTKSCFKVFILICMRDNVIDHTNTVDVFVCSMLFERVCSSCGCLHKFMLCSSQCGHGNTRENCETLLRNPAQALPQRFH